MVNDMIVALKAGCELDKRIADAIGISIATITGGEIPVVLITQREWDKLHGREDSATEGGVAAMPFRPSTDLNDAFAAAERIVESKGADFELSPYVSLGERGWTCQMGDSTERGFAKTPALAICAAILQLEEK